MALLLRFEPGSESDRNRRVCLRDVNRVHKSRDLPKYKRVRDAKEVTVGYGKKKKEKRCLSGHVVIVTEIRRFCCKAF